MLLKILKISSKTNNICSGVTGRMFLSMRLYLYPVFYIQLQLVAYGHD